MARAAYEPTVWLEAEASSSTAEPESEQQRPAAVTTIDLSHQQLTMASLQLLPPTLTCVDLSRCGLESIAPLGSLPRLELLNVSYNRLSSLDDVRGCARLIVLYARSNRIADVSGARALESLQSLDLECNTISTLDALVPLWGLPSLSELRLPGNVLPLSYRRACTAHLPACARSTARRSRRPSLPRSEPSPPIATPSDLIRLRMLSAGGGHRE